MAPTIARSGFKNVVEARYVDWIGNESSHDEKRGNYWAHRFGLFATG
jgi:hypothetical protein